MSNRMRCMKDMSLFQIYSLFSKPKHILNDGAAEPCGVKIGVYEIFVLHCLHKTNSHTSNKERSVGVGTSVVQTKDGFCVLVSL